MRNFSQILSEQNSYGTKTRVYLCVGNMNRHLWVTKGRWDIILSLAYSVELLTRVDADILDFEISKSRRTLELWLEFWVDPRKSSPHLKWKSSACLPLFFEIEAAVTRAANGWSHGKDFWMKIVIYDVDPQMKFQLRLDSPFIPRFDVEYTRGKRVNYRREDGTWRTYWEETPIDYDETLRRWEDRMTRLDKMREKTGF